MKKEVAEYFGRCLECHQVKAEHQNLVGMLHPLPIPKWKWDTIYIDFVTRLPKSKKSNNSIMVVVDVNVGIFIHPSVVEILLLYAFLGVSSDQLHSIRSWII